MEILTVFLINITQRFTFVFPKHKDFIGFMDRKYVIK